MPGFCLCRSDTRSGILDAGRSADDGDAVIATERIVNQTRGREIGGRIRRAGNPWSRFVGLLGRRGLAEGEGLHIVPCSSLHMFFMRFPLDIVYLDAGLQVLKTVENLRPWRVSAGRGAKTTLELPTGTIARTGTQPGDQLTSSRE
jgi:uncharacterized membrane protein (UPF0127 family)